MLGAIAGDIIGSTYEFESMKDYNFQLLPADSFFTDDSVLTIALADSIINNKSYVKNLKKYVKEYPNRGYGGRFLNWANSDNLEPYNSFGNGSAMRVSPVGWAYDTIEEVLQKSKESAEVTHNHPEGIKGAQAVASAIFLARMGERKDNIKKYITTNFSYDLDRNTEEIRKIYKFDVTCQGSVPESIIAFLESTDYVDAVRRSVSLGGDSDTQGCITGSIAEAFYKKIPSDVIDKVYELLDDDLTQITKNFIKKYVKY